MKKWDNNVANFVEVNYIDGLKKSEYKDETESKRGKDRKRGEWVSERVSERKFKLI